MMFLFNRQSRKIKLTDEDKKLVLERYSDIDWRDDVTHMRCISCHKVAIVSYVLDCKHLICRRCFDGSSKLCPRCGQIVRKVNASDAEIESKLCQLKVSCPNKKYGCQQVDQLGMIVDHLRGCTHVPIRFQGPPNTMDALYRYVSEQLRQMRDEMRVMKSESEVKMNEIELKVDSKVDQLNRDFDGIQAKLEWQTEMLRSYELQHKGGYVDKKMLNAQYQLNAMDNPMKQSTTDLNESTTDLQVHKENPTRIESKEKDPVKKKTQNLKYLREEIEKLKSEQTRLSAKAKEVIETIYTIKGRADTFIQLLEQKDKKMKKKLNKHESDMKNMMDFHKEQLEDMKTRMAWMDEEQKTNQIAMGLLESNISELNKDLNKQQGQVTTTDQHGKNERNKEVEQMTTVRPTSKIEFVQNRLEEVETRMHKDNDELRFLIYNQTTTTKNLLAAVDSRVKNNDNRLGDMNNKMTTVCNELATIDNRVTIYYDGMTTTINDLTTINNDADDIVNLIEETNEKVDVNSHRITSTNKQVNACHNRIAATNRQLDVTTSRITTIDNKMTTMTTKLTLMEVWLANAIAKISPSQYNDLISAARKKVKNFEEFGTLGQKDGCLVCEFTWKVENIEEEMAKAKDVKYCIESKPFYTNVPGYKVVLRLFPNDRQSNHVGVYLGLVEGEFDDILPWPFPCKYELYSVGRDGTRFASISVNPSTETTGRNSFIRPTNNALGYGDTEYVKRETLLANKGRYLTDGVLSIKATFWLSN